MLNGFSSIETEMYVCMGPNKIYPTILSPPRFIRPIDEYALYNILVNWQSDRGEPVPWKHETPFDVSRILAQTTQKLPKTGSKFKGCLIIVRSDGPPLDLPLPPCNL